MDRKLVIILLVGVLVLAIVALAILLVIASTDRDYYMCEYAGSSYHFAFVVKEVYYLRILPQIHTPMYCNFTHEGMILWETHVPEQIP